MTCLFGRTESPIDIMASYDFMILHINRCVDIHSGDPNSLQLGKHSSSIGGCEPQNEAKEQYDSLPKSKRSKYLKVCVMKPSMNSKIQMSSKTVRMDDENP